MNERMRVLFVDDERQVLDGLRNLLRRDRLRWDLVFAEGGQAALEKVREQPFDMVVSDMRMPGLDGPALLQRIKTDYPATVRVVLSGQADREAVLRSMPVAQQFLSKPCSEETLRRTIERTERITRLVAELPVRVLMGGLDRLATPAVLRHQLGSALAAGSPARVCALASQDPALAAKLLQLANWECFGGRQVTSSVERAVEVLGLDVVATLVRAPEEPSGNLDAPANPARLRRSARAAAGLARKLVADPECEGQAFAAGLLHDVAWLALASAGAPGEWRRPEEVARLGEVGGYLLAVWGLPEPVVEAVIHHRQPSRAGSPPFEVLGAVHVAVSLIEGWLAGAGETAPLALDHQYLEALGLTDRLPAWRALGEAEARAFLTETP
jgi:CheY-like chemotaxis protein